MLDPNIKNDRIINSSFALFLYSVPPIRVDTKTYTSICKVRSNYHDYPQLWYCQEGECIHETEYGEYRSGPGSMLIVPPGVLHRYVVPEAHEVTLTRIDFAIDYLADISFYSAPNTVAALFLPPFLRPLGAPRPEFYRLSEPTRCILEDAINIFSDSKTEESVKRNLIELFFSQPEFALSDAEKEKTAETARTRLYPVMRALSYMHANYTRKITAEHLCQISYLCRTNLFRLIRQYLGISCASYLVMLRVIRANYALVHTNYSIEYISDMCGFSHSSHMSKCYKRYKGILPKEDRMKQTLYQQRYGRLHITHEYFMRNFFD